MNEHKMKVCTSMISLILLFSVSIIPITIVGNDTVQNDSEKSAQTYMPFESMNVDDIPDIYVMIGEISLSIFMIVPNHHTVIVFESSDTVSVVEYKTELSNNKYQTTIILDGTLISEFDSDKNILAPVEKSELESSSPNRINSLAARNIQNPLTASYSYKWWDGVYQVTKPLYLIKYIHPDRDYYEIAPWNDWSIAGIQTTHNQINSYTSGILIPGGMAAIFAAIGAFLTAEMGPGGVAAGAFIGAILGTVVGYLVPAILGDEAGCIWFWWGNYYNSWFMANLWWLIATGPFGLGAAIGALLKVGYLKIGWVYFQIQWESVVHSIILSEFEGVGQSHPLFFLINW